MNTDPLRRVKTAKKKRDRVVAEVDEELHAAIAAAVAALVPVQDVADASGYHRNHVARIARDRGVPDARTLKRRRAEPES